MRNFFDTYNIVVGAVIALFTTIFGAYWYIFAAYMVLNIFDWLTGWYKSRRARQESSAVGLKGIVKKLGYWILIAVAFIVSTVFVKLGQDVLHVDLAFLNMIGWFTLACLMVNEVRSIIENLVELGYNVPLVLIKGLAVTEELINKTTELEEERNE
jgi:toxin secretion/phage lysis holin|nr:MAG TPA: holin [Caudoviricetes sp.]